MKTLTSLLSAHSPRRTFSFELVPPSTTRSTASSTPFWLPFLALGPLFVTIARKSDFLANPMAQELASLLASQNITSCLNVTCRAREGAECGTTKAAHILATVDRFRALGGNNLLILQGDAEQPSSQHDDFAYASDLLSFLKRDFKEAMCCAVGGYPEGHPSNWDSASGLKFTRQEVQRLKELRLLAAKAALGAEVVMCQASLDGGKVKSFARDVQENCCSSDTSLAVVPSILGPMPRRLFFRYTSLMQIDVGDLVPWGDTTALASAAAREICDESLFLADFHRLLAEKTFPQLASFSNHLHIFVPAQCCVKEMERLLLAWQNVK